MSISGNGCEDHLLTLANRGRGWQWWNVNLYFSFHKGVCPAKNQNYPCLTLSYTLFSEDIAYFQPHDTTSHLDYINI